MKLNLRQRSRRQGARKLAAILRSLEIRPGRTEVEVACEILFYGYALGMADCSFEPLVASGKRAAIIHGFFSAKKIQPAEMVVVDCGLDYKGYATDMTRTFFVGKPDKRYLKIYNAVRAAQRAAIKSIRSGVPAAKVYQQAHAVLKGDKLDKYFKHAPGHGIGRKVHQPPRLAAKSKAILRSGMVVTVEPGVYIPGWGGIRIEDMVLVKPTGCEVLTK